MSIRSKTDGYYKKTDGYYNGKCFSKPILKVVGFLVSCMVFATTLQGCSIIPREDDVLAPPLIKPVKVTYELYEVKRQTILDTMRGGATFIYNRHSSLLYKNNGGRLKAIYVKLGDSIKKGTLLAELENKSILDMIKQTGMELEKARLRLRLAEIDKQAKRANPDPSPEELERADINIKLQQLEVDTIEYKLENLMLDYNSTKLVSALDGIVTYVSDAGEGDIIQSYTTLIEIADPTELILDWRCTDSARITSLHKGMEVDVEIGSKQYKGRIIATPVDFINEVNKDSYRNTIRIEVEGIPDNVNAGSDARVSVILQKRDDALVISKDALRIEMGGSYVLVLKDSIKRERTVEPGLITSTEVEILNGLEEGEQVILK